MNFAYIFRLSLLSTAPPLYSLLRPCRNRVVGHFAALLSSAQGLFPSVLTIMLLLGFLAAPAGADDSHVQCRLLTDVSAIVPGKPFMLGVLLKIDPGWHVYLK